MKTLNLELTTFSGSLFLGLKVIISGKFEELVLKLLHEREKSLARLHVWWLSITTELNSGNSELYQLCSDGKRPKSSLTFMGLTKGKCA